MSEVGLFMPKKKKGVANRQARTGPPIAGPSSSIAGTTLPRKQVGPPKPTLPTASQPSIPSSSSSSNADVKPNPHITEIKLYSTDPNTRIRSNLMKFMSARDFDPVSITKPIFMNRKQPGVKEIPIHALDDEGKIVGKYLYDEGGQPVMGQNGHPVIEKKDVGLDPDMVGNAPGTKRKLKKGVKEVFHQDLNIVRMKREEATPWVLETGKPRPEGQAQALGHVPEHWVGRMIEQSSLPTVLLVNDGRIESGFEIVPLGRTYRFTPERPFKTLDADAANKLFEHQMKHKVHDRWSQRPDGPALMGNAAGPSGSSSGVKTEHDDMASRWETRMRGAQPVKVKVEKYEDDFKREGRQQERGMEGGVDEELDYDVAEDFQDDDENNTFYHDQEEEEETKYQEEQIKKEQRLANATFGDRAQIDKVDDEDDLFGENEGKLNVEGKRLRKMMRERGGGDDYDSSDSDSSDSSETIKDDKSEKSTKGDKEKEKEKEKENTKSAPGSAERPPRPQSRGPSFRQTTSPSGSGNGKRPNYPQHGKSGTAPPGSGAAFLAHRATGSRGASPKARSRGNSPHNRATSPESRDGRGMSPPSRDVSPSRALSPGREGTPTHQPQHNRPPGGPSHGKRKTTTASPQPGSNTNTNTNTNSPKRKPSPTPSNNSEPRSKKKKSSTPDVAPFPLQITQGEVIAWFKTQPEAGVAMSGPIKAFAPKLKATASENRDANQKLFMRWVNEVTVKENGKLVLKPEYK